MSTYNELDLICPDCGEEYKGTVWTAIHAQQDPELKDILLGGELNLMMCPKCSHVTYQDHFVLYQDPIAELYAYIYPPAQQVDENFLRQTMMKNFQEAQAIYPPKERKDYDPILIFGLETFVEMMEKEEERGRQSQVAEAVCEETEVPYLLLRPSEARPLEMMRVLPLGKAVKKPKRGDVLSGLENLLTENPELDLYADLQKKIIADPQWKIPEGYKLFSQSL